jgi:hypothetical protein
MLFIVVKMFAAWESERCRAAATMLGRMVASRNYPQTGLEEINGDLLEADFWPTSLRVPS